LLKILSRITEPTTGVIKLFGRVGSLLEVGTGFHPELTGRENISLNGAILGMTKSEIRKQFDAIVDFSEVEKFLDTPVKRYSSGMYIRLAFAVAAHLNPEILIVDEVLAVGDSEFQTKCMGKMEDVKKSGRTILFVSHNMAAISKLCSRAVYLKHGNVLFDDDTPSVIEQYLQSQATLDIDLNPQRVNSATRLITSVRVLDRYNQPRNTFSIGDPLILELEYRNIPGIDLSSPAMGIVINNKFNTPVATINMRMTGSVRRLQSESGATIQCVLQRLQLTPGNYTVDFHLGDSHIDYDILKAAAIIRVESTDYYGSGYPPSDIGDLVLDAEWSVVEN
jgi:lipopolysaccharide transport system ATP-binding protein